MKEKMITIVTLPYSKAFILKSRLESRGIQCVLEDLAFTEGAGLISFKVMILEKDLLIANEVANDFLGKKKPALLHNLPPEERHILVPVDFSPVSEKACKIAFNLAQHLNMKLVIMHSYINPLIYSLPYSDVFAYDSGMLIKLELADKNAGVQVFNFIKRMIELTGEENWKTVQTEVVIKSGYAEEDILSYANNNHSQLVVMGSGGKLSSTNPVGSIAADVMYNATVPVLLIPENTSDSEISDFTKVVYATNFDQKDFIVIDKLMSLLYPFRVKLFCVHVEQKTDDLWDTTRMYGLKDFLAEKYRDQEFECRMLEGEDIPEVIEKFVVDEQINVISLTTHKRKMISRLFNPGITRKMAYHINKPLLIFHT